jgi:hypothetical protein
MRRKDGEVFWTEGCHNHMSELKQQLYKGKVMEMIR